MGLIKGTVTHRNVYKICRVCLEDKDGGLSFTDIIEIPENSSTVSDVFNKITASIVDQENSLPQLICIDCVKLLEASYLFKLKYEESLEILSKYLESMKEESLKIESDNENPFIEENLQENIQKRPRPRRGVRKKKAFPIVKTELHSEVSDNEEVDHLEYVRSNLHPCPICTQEFNALDLREHVQSHKALKKYLTIPEKRKITSKVRFFATKDVTNMISLFNRTGDKHKCPYCDRDFTIDKFRVHAELHRHQDEYKCEDCGRVFRKLNHLNTHRVKHLKEYPFKCEDCGKGFVIKTNYDCHMLTHTNTELPHECSYCLKRFSNPEHLNRHLIIHTENVSYSVKYKVCKCHHCLKTFKDKNELQNHHCVPIEQISTSQYPCKKCNKVFKHSSGLYNHTRNIHKLKGAKTLCSVCGNYVSNIYNHMMRHNGEKPYHCDQCEKCFFTKPQLRQHLLVHSGLKPFVCSVCAKAFNNLYNLQVHERIHKGDRCHICTICNKGFLEKSYLKKHMQVHQRLQQ